MARSTPRVDETTLVDPSGAASSIAVGSPAWYAWLEVATTFTFRGAQGSFTARKERQGQAGWYWKAYRRRKGTLHRAYLGKSTDLTLERLNAVAAVLAPPDTRSPQVKSAGTVGPSLDQSNSEPSPLSSATLPTGTVTFLFTDIEGSTQRWEQHPELMRNALARHDAILHQTIATHGGVVFKTIGDAVCAAFASAPAALMAALASQRALVAASWGSSNPLRVRMALHTGSVEVHDGDYLGLPLSRAARLLVSAHGGQILLSLATQELVRDDLPPAAELRDLGTHRLKDLIRPEHIYQLVVADLPARFPPLQTLASRPNNLPVQQTPLIGREREVVTACALLRRDDVHLLTLSGPGGTGKTRLALQVAADLLDTFTHGVFFVALAPISDPNMVPTVIAQALGVVGISSEALIASLKAYLHNKHILLVLDNFEQIVEAAPLLGELLAVAPQLKLLVTSRTVLHLSGEHEFAVPPLVLPDRNRLPPLERLTQYAAVQLFIARAQAVKAEFTVTNANAPAVAEICHRLDGLPLAIELAAARVKLFSPLALLERLRSPLSLLTGGARDVPTRQQTLRNTIDWSFTLLNAGEQALFARLGVFVGGCTLQAAEVVCNSTSDLTVDVLDGVAALVDQSLLQQQEEVGGEPRFTMLATIQEYAQERLTERGEADSIHWQHATYFLELAEAAEPAIEGPERADWLVRLEQEHDNLRAALAWSQIAPGGEELGLRLAGALWVFWFEHGHRHEGRRWLEATLARSDIGVAPTSRVKVLDGAVVLAIAHGHYRQAQALAEEGLALARDAGHSVGVAGALSGLGEVAVLQGDYARAVARYEESLAVSQELADTWLIANALSRLGDVAYLQGDYMRAVTLFEQGLTLSRELNDQAGIAWALGKLGRAAYAQSDSARALALCEESLALYRRLENKGDIAQLLGILGHIVHAQGDSTRSGALFAESLSIYEELGDAWGIANGLAGLAGVLGDQGQPERAARLFGAAEALRETIGAQMGVAERAEYAQAVASVLSQLAASTVATAWAAGRALSAEQAIAEAREHSCLPASTIVAPSGEPRVRQAVPFSSPALVEPLSARELEILRLIAAGHSNQAIADTLVIAVSTVKRHINNIYGKLDVQSRTQALLRARELSLL